MRPSMSSTTAVSAAPGRSGIRAATSSRDVSRGSATPVVEEDDGEIRPSQDSSGVPSDDGGQAPSAYVEGSTATRLVTGYPLTPVTVVEPKNTGVVLAGSARISGTI